MGTWKVDAAHADHRSRPEVELSGRTALRALCDVPPRSMFLYLGNAYEPAVATEGRQPHRTGPCRPSASSSDDHHSGVGRYIDPSPLLRRDLHRRKVLMKPSTTIYYNCMLYVAHPTRITLQKRRKWFIPRDRRVGAVRQRCAVPSAARHCSVYRRPHSVVVTECGRRSNQQCRVAQGSLQHRSGQPDSPPNTSPTRLR